ncbi:LAFA_0G10308g1_1 [Lachancea sp. 'fantastica']|nr:LAFA_0G10308g1_1 [Lachancea sp. 'fantastica']
MRLALNPTEEHYLKRELLKQELTREIQCLNDPEALRKFGFPFTSGDPNVSRKKSRRSKSSPNSSPSETSSETSLSSTEYPLLSHFLQHFVMKLPLFSKEMIEKEEFWQQKVQVFFEHFMQLNFSSSFDREELTKRRKLGIKLSKIVLLMYNSGIGSAQEPQYFQQDEFKLSDGEETNFRHHSNLDQFVMPSKETLKFLLTQEPYFINGWDFNVISVAPYSTLYPEVQTKTKPTTTSSSWMKSALAFAPTAFSSPTKLLAKMSLSGDSNEKRYHFVIRGRQESTNESWYVIKNYADFKRLVADLNKEFPGKELPKLPNRSKVGISTTSTAKSLNTTDDGSNPVTPREKIIASFDSSSPAPEAVASEPEKTDEHDDFEEFEDATETITKHLPREKMRTSLRKFLRSIAEDKETAKSVSLLKFINTGRWGKEQLPLIVAQDIQNREAVDLANLQNEVAFQKLAFEQTLELQTAMKEFKTLILKDDQYLIKLFREIKEKESVAELSPTLRSFMGWCRINLSATIYTTFLGSDGGYEIFTQVKRLHKLLPYTVMVQILKIANPMAMMKGMMDLFMARPFGGNSLLQTMFSSVLTDDLKSQLKLAKELEELIGSESKFGIEITQVLSKSIFENEASTFINLEEVHDEALNMSMPLVLVLIMKCGEKGYLSQDALAEVLESYALWKNRNDTEERELTRVDSSISIADVPGLYFSHLKGLFQIYIRERDKKLMKQVWQDPELSRLLKSMVALFYEPLVRIFRVARVDVAFRNFERFMDDLVSLLDNVINGQGTMTTSSNIVDDINKLVEKHEDSLFQFIHDICVHDEENTFENMITYLTTIVSFLQKSKFGDEKERLDLVQLVETSAENGVDSVKLKEQLEELVESKKVSRRLYQKIVASRVSKKTKKALNLREIMDQKWQESNDAAMPNAISEVGLQDGDLVDLDLDVGDFTFLQDDEEDALQREYQDVLEKAIDVSEISKMTEVAFKNKLVDLLSL